jgi:hypothetical protein
MKFCFTFAGHTLILKNMYEFVKAAHYGLRWILLLVLLFVIVKSWMGLIQKNKYAKVDNATSGALVGLAHLQLLLGLLLYFGLSPIMKVAFSDFGAAMKDSQLRLIAVEHFVTMLSAVALIQVGRILSKKATDDAAKYKKMAIFATAALFLMLSRMPHWNF